MPIKFWLIAVISTMLLGGGGVGWGGEGAALHPLNREDQSWEPNA